MARRFIRAVDTLSRAVGHAFAWCVVILTMGTCYEVFVRYVLRDPTSWAFDMSYLLYGALFLMSGAYALSRNAARSSSTRVSFSSSCAAPRSSSARSRPSTSSAFV